MILIGLALILASEFYLALDLITLARGWYEITLLHNLLVAAHRLGMPYPEWQALGFWLSPFLMGIILLVYGSTTDARRMRR
ncbi:MAG: hypothetical protein G01um101429_689 [Parcubacteria group bacterium Gr01-1014_29]|nr:MAG: hypothetical protein G01um101429_689 [Parcubacteria group bacterium Gr01-1014_29]